MQRRFTGRVMILISVLLLGCFAISWGSAATGQDDLTAVVKGNNAFAFDLYTKLVNPTGNLFFSPYSISAALAMTYAGARGETARQMEQALHFGGAAGLHPGFAKLMRQFNTAGKSYQLAVANALWGQLGTEFYPKFLEITNRYYEAGFKEVDYIRQTEQARLMINDWVETKTNHKIVELIKPGVLNDLTRLVLTNAIYFKGQWESQFDPDATLEKPFYTSAAGKSDVPLMQQLGTFKYTETAQLQLLELPYTGGEIVMDILLPKPGSDLAGLEAGLQLSGFESWLANMELKLVQVFLPRFKLEKELSLVKSLQALGMTDAFDESRADFSGMSDTRFYITHVIHKAYAGINEEGTEAAAATAVVMETKSAPMDHPLIFRADHPFLFLIRDARSGSILFMGRMAEPRSQGVVE
jgi:serine protease inhibitor